jgi:hypothetical protein
MVSTRSQSTRSTRRGVYATVIPVSVKHIKYIKYIKRSPSIKNEHISKLKKAIKIEKRKSERTIKKTVQFDLGLYGRNIETGERNQYHGWGCDKWQRDFNGNGKQSRVEEMEEKKEDELIRRIKRRYKTGFAGYILDNFIVDEEEEESDYSDSESDED